MNTESISTLSSEATREKQINDQRDLLILELASRVESVKYLGKSILAESRFSAFANYCRENNKPQ